MGVKKILINFSRLNFVKNGRIKFVVRKMVNKLLIKLKRIRLFVFFFYIILGLICKIVIRLSVKLIK